MKWIKKAGEIACSIIASLAILVVWISVAAILLKYLELR